MAKEANRLKETCRTVEEEDEIDVEEAWDDACGAPLELEEVKRARREEIDYVHKINFYDKAPISEVYKNTGKGPISVRWIDINKGDQESPNYRSRLVAREVNTNKRNDLFRATPPLEALNLVFSFTASGNKGEVIMVNDISRAFFHAPAKRKVYVQPPSEDQEKGQEGICGRLSFSLYRNRDAAQKGFDAYSKQLIEIGFKQGTTSPCTFYHPQSPIRTYVHGDDYVSAGQPPQLKWLQNQLEKTYHVKHEYWVPVKSSSNMSISSIE